MSESENQSLPSIKMQTSQGEIHIELFEDEAPNTVSNMIELSEQGFYDGLVFHRVAKLILYEDDTWVDADSMNKIGDLDLSELGLEKLDLK